MRARRAIPTTPANRSGSALMPENGSVLLLGIITGDGPFRTRTSITQKGRYVITFEKKGEDSIVTNVEFTPPSLWERFGRWYTGDYGGAM